MIPIPTKVYNRRPRQVLTFRHPPSWSFARLRELHLVASGQRPAQLQVLDASLDDKYARLAYENALGSFMGMQAILSYQSLDALMSQLADFLEANGIDGLEAPLLSGLFGLEGLSLGKPGRTSTVERLSQILRNSPVPQPIAGGLGRIPVVDRIGRRINFYTSDGISQMLSDVSPWLRGPDAGMGGLGGFGGPGSTGPIFNGFRSRIGQLSAETDASGGFCSGFGTAASIAVVGIVSTVFTIGGAEIGAAVGSLGGPVGTLAGALIFGAMLGQTTGAMMIEIEQRMGWPETLDQTCQGWFAPDDDESDTDAPDEEEMPNPTSDETGLPPTEIQIAIGLAKLNSAKRIDPSQQTIFIGRQPVIVSSLAAKRQLVITPNPDPVVQDLLGSLGDIILGPRPDPAGPLVGRSGTVFGEGIGSVQVQRDLVTVGFGRTTRGEYVVGAPLGTQP